LTFSRQLESAVVESKLKLSPKLRKALRTLFLGRPTTAIPVATWKRLASYGFVQLLTGPWAQPTLTVMGRLAMAEEIGFPRRSVRWPRARA
jgi:hypothetical protein